LIVKYGVNASLFSKEIERIEKKNTIEFMHGGFYQMCSNLVGSHATNGFVSILLALKYFSSVSCFGFTFCKEMHTPDWDRLYYFMPAIPPKDWEKTNCHSNKKESEIIDALSKTNILKFYEC